MNEWILIIVINIISGNGSMRDVSIETITGFNTKKSCEIASNKIGLELIDIVGRSRRQQRIKGHNFEPRINGNCINIFK